MKINIRFFGTFIALSGAMFSICCDRAAPPALRLAFGSCIRQDEPQPIWEAIRRRRPDRMLLLGDNVYADGRDMIRKRRAYRTLAAVPGFVRLRAETEVLAVWDDHDYGANDLGGDYPAKQASEKIFLDAFEVPADDPRRSRPGIYFAREIGPPAHRVQIIMLDLRYFRDALEPAPKRHPRKRVYLPTKDTGKTLLGEAQWRWLEEQLRRPVRLRIIASSIQFISIDHTGERWDAFPHERARFLRLLRETEAKGVVLISGDRHYGEIARLTEGAPHPLYEFTSSGFNSVWEYGSREPNRYRIGRTHPVHNFGMLEIDWREETITGALHGEDGRVLQERTIEFGEIGY